MLLIGHTWALASKDYRFGFNGSEKTNGIISDNYLNDFGSRFYDARIGRWFSEDPYNQFHSPYVGLGNSPIWGYDENGEFWQYVAGFVVGAGISAWNSYSDYKSGKISGWQYFDKIILGGATGVVVVAAPGLTPVWAMGSDFIDQKLIDRKSFSDVDYVEVGVSGFLGYASMGLGNKFTPIARGWLESSRWALESVT